MCSPETRVATGAKSWRPSAHDAPFFRIRQESGRIVTEGSPRCEAGHLGKIRGDTDPFVAWNWDGSRLQVWNDRYGFQPLFYWTGAAGDLIISTSLHRLLELGAPTEIDTDALAAFFRLGFFLGEDTPFKSIRLLPPNACMSWQDGELNVSGSYRILCERPIRREAAMDGYIELFREAIRRRPPCGSLAVPLSGGRDSRHIFLELCERGWLPNGAISVRFEPYLMTDDVKIAALLAKEAGVRHLVWDTPQNTIEREWRKNIETHMSTTEHGWIPTVTDELGASFDTLYEGVAGDLLSTCFANSEERQSRLERGELEWLAESLLGDEGYLPKALPVEQYRLMSRDAARARLIRELRRHTEAANPLGSFLLWNRCRRVTGLPPTCLWNQGRMIWCPYLDGDLFDFLSALPARVLLSAEYHQFHTDTIIRAYPRFAHIPFAGKMSKRVSVPAYERRLLRDLARAAVSLGDSTLLRKSYLYPRLLRGFIDSRYGTEIPGLAKFSFYLLQLEALQKRKSGIPVASL